jgi:putative FmdB family regulatory protein
MPIYEYACSHCGKELEVEQKISDPPLKSCPSCQRETLERLISRAAFHLKGGGWYADGYGGGSGTKASANGSSATSTSASDGGGGGAGAKAPEKKEAAPAAPSTPAPKPDKA